MPDIQQILDALQVDKAVKADAWDAFNSVKSPEEFTARFDAMPLPKEAKAALWDQKFGSVLTVTPAPTNGKTTIPGPWDRIVGHAKETLPKVAGALTRFGAPTVPIPQAKMTVEQGREAMQTPVVKPSLLLPQEKGDVPLEAMRGVVEGIEGLGSAENVSLLFGIGGAGAAARTLPKVGMKAFQVADTALSAYFSGAMGTGAYEAGKNAWGKVKAGDYPGAAHDLGLGSVESLFAILAGKHAVGKSRKLLTKQTPTKTAAPMPSPVAVAPAAVVPTATPAAPPLQAAKKRVRARAGALRGKVAGPVEPDWSDVAPEAQKPPVEAVPPQGTVPPTKDLAQLKKQVALVEAAQTAGVSYATGKPLNAITKKAQRQWLNDAKKRAEPKPPPLAEGEKPKTAEQIFREKKQAAKALADEQKAQAEAKTAELKAKIQAMPPAEVEKATAEAVKQLPDEQLREVAAAQELPKSPKSGEPEPALTPLAETVADELTRRKTTPITSPETPAFGTPEYARWLNTRTRGAVVRTTTPTPEPAAIESVPAASLETPPVNSFRNEVGTYTPLGEEAGGVRYRFTNLKGNVHEDVMPRGKWDDLASKGEPLAPAPPVQPPEVPPAPLALGGEPVAPPREVTAPVPAAGGGAKGEVTPRVGAPAEGAREPIVPSYNEVVPKEPPIIAYHGTADFRGFGTTDTRPMVERPHAIPGETESNEAYWFTENQRAAQQYANGGGGPPGYLKPGAQILEREIHLDNPLIVDMNDPAWSPKTQQHRGWSQKAIDSGKVVHEIGFIKEKAVRLAHREGKDGVIFLNGYDHLPARSGRIIAAFSPDQIKERPPIAGAAPDLAPPPGPVTATAASPIEAAAAPKGAGAAGRPVAVPAFAPRAVGNMTEVKTARGTKVETQYAVADIGSLTTSHDVALNENPAYPQELQPRNRTRAASEVQVVKIYGELDPKQLGENYLASEGAPIIGPDGVVESGNGRTIALKRLYGDRHANAEKYRAWLAEHASEFGLKPEDAAAVKNPVLVRIRKTEVDRPQFALEANESPTAEMSATERATSDAKKLTGDLMDSFRPNDRGEIITQANNDFVRGFFKDVIGPFEHGRYQDAEGRINQEGVGRIRNAVFARAYGDTSAIERLAEATDSNTRNVTNGMLAAAPRLAKVQEGIKQGELHDLDITGEIAQAVRKLSELRDKGQRVEDYLNQGNLFGEDLSPETADLLNVFEQNKRSANRVGEILTTYADAMEAAGHPKQQGLFGASRTIPSKMELLEAAIRRVEERHAKNTLFQEPPVGRGETAKPATATRPPQEVPTEGKAELAIQSDLLQAASARAKQTIAERKAKLTPKPAETVLPPKEGERGSFSLKPAEKDAILEGAEYSKRPNAARVLLDTMFRSVGSRLQREGPEGKVLVGKIYHAEDVGATEAGPRIARLMIDGGLHELSPEQRWSGDGSLIDVLRNEAPAASPEIQKAADIFRSIAKDTATEAKAAKFMKTRAHTFEPGELPSPEMKLTSQQKISLRLAEEADRRVRLRVKSPFEERKDYFPQVIPNTDILGKKGPIRRDITANLQRLGVVENAEEAQAFIDGYRKYVDGGGRVKALEQYLVDSGQAKNEAEAFKLLEIFRKQHIHRQGSLEYSRDIDLPLWDPDPLRILPVWTHDVSMRLAQVREFGQNNEVINKLVRSISQNPNAINVRLNVNKALRIANEPDTGIARASRYIRIAQGFRLGTAAIANSVQGTLNPLLVTKRPDIVIRGWARALKPEGRRFGMESGASLEGIINEMVRYAGEDSAALSKFLTGVGFTPTERWNRVLSANMGRIYADSMLERLKKNPQDGEARFRLEQMGLGPDNLLAIGKVTGQDALIAAKRFSDLTQFRARYLDLPEWASTPMGRVAFQFKNFAFNQFKLMQDEIVGELRRGRPGEAAGAFLVLATAFPLTGEAVLGLRKLVSGRKREDEGLERYWNDIAANGALGVASDFMQSMAWGKERMYEWAAGPTGSETGTTAYNLYAGGRAGIKKDDWQMRSLARQVFGRIPIAGPRIANYVFPLKKPARDFAPLGKGF